MNTLLIDGNSLLQTSFRGTLKTDMFDKNINGIYMFLSKFRKILLTKYKNKQLAFDKVVCFWDGKNSGQLAIDLYSDYKITRRNKRAKLTGVELLNRSKFKQQKTRLQEYIDCITFQYEDNVVEADALIALYVINANKDEKIWIATSDVDIMMLISETVSIYYLNNGRKIKSLTKKNEVKRHNRQNSNCLLITHENFKYIFLYPYQNILTIKILCGDPSDDIKNIYRLSTNKLVELFPYIIETPNITYLDIIADAKTKLETEDYENKNKKILENIVNGLTKGKQGDKFYEINSTIINLHKPMVTDTAKENLSKLEILSSRKYNTKDSTIFKNLLLEDSINKEIKDFYRFGLKKFFEPFKQFILH